MIVTSTEFKQNLGRYLELVSEEEIIITKNGHRIAKLIPDQEDLVSVAQSLFGIAVNEISTDDKIKEERIKGRYGVEFDD